MISHSVMDSKRKMLICPVHKKETSSQKNEVTLPGFTIKNGSMLYSKSILSLLFHAACSKHSFTYNFHVLSEDSWVNMKNTRKIIHLTLLCVSWCQTWVMFRIIKCYTLPLLLPARVYIFHHVFLWCSSPISSNFSFRFLSECNNQ